MYTGGQERCEVCSKLHNVPDPLCTSECPTTALEQCGREWTMEDLMLEVEKERDIMTDSGGGDSQFPRSPSLAETHRQPLAVSRCRQG